MSETAAAAAAVWNTLAYPGEHLRDSLSVGRVKQTGDRKNKVGTL